MFGRTDIFDRFVYALETGNPFLMIVNTVIVAAFTIFVDDKRFFQRFPGGADAWAKEVV